MLCPYCILYFLVTPPPRPLEKTEIQTYRMTDKLNRNYRVDASVLLDMSTLDNMHALPPKFIIVNQTQCTCWQITTSTQYNVP